MTGQEICEIVSSVTKSIIMIYLIYQIFKDQEGKMSKINYQLLKEMIDCASREVSLRFALYPKRIQAGKMSKEQADKEIQLMQMIRNSLKKVYENKAPETVQQAFFDTREYNKSNFKHWE